MITKLIISCSISFLTIYLILVKLGMANPMFAPPVVLLFLIAIIAWLINILLRKIKTKYISIKYLIGIIVGILPGAFIIIFFKVMDSITPLEDGVAWMVMGGIMVMAIGFITGIITTTIACIKLKK